MFILRAAQDLYYRLCRRIHELQLFHLLQYNRADHYYEPRSIYSYRNINYAKLHRVNVIDFDSTTRSNAQNDAGCDNAYVSRRRYLTNSLTVKPPMRIINILADHVQSLSKEMQPFSIKLCKWCFAFCGASVASCSFYITVLFTMLAFNAHHFVAYPF